MKFNSITFKLVFFVVAAFIITGISVIYVADYRLIKIIDKSQQVMYSNMLDVIWNELNRTDGRLQKTGLVQTYKNDFQLSVIKTLREIYYTENNQQIYPFIIDTDARVVMHPILETGDLSLQHHNSIDKFFVSAKGDFITKYHGVTKWYIFQHFKPWNWVICYAVPLNIKYKDVIALKNALIAIIVGISVVVLGILIFLLSRITRPIVSLTQISTRIADGDFDQKIDISGKDEVRTLALSFSRMRDAVKNRIFDLNLQIDKRKKAQEALKISEDKFSKIFFLSPDGIAITLLSNGKLIEANKVFADNLGYKREEIINSSTIELGIFKNAYERDEIVKQLLQNNYIQGLEITGTTRTGKIMTGELSSVIIDINNEKCVLSFVRDITEKKKMEEIMVQSEKMLSLGGLAAGMAHEINNPLAGVIQTSNVMAERLSRLDMPANIKAAQKIGIKVEDIKAYMETRDVLRMAGTIKDSGTRIAKLVRNMLGFARKSENALSSHDPARLFEKALELAITDYDLKKQYEFKTIKIVKDYEENLPMILCESEKIQQVLLNILRNGAQAMQEAMEQNHEYKNPKFIFRLFKEIDTNMLCMEIEDNGPGMDKTTRKRIFEPFFTTKPVGVGTGLGLSVSYFIITKNHNGELSVESTPGVGTKFIIRLPLEIK